MIKQKASILISVLLLLSIFIILSSNTNAYEFCDIYSCEDNPPSCLQPYQTTTNGSKCCSRRVVGTQLAPESILICDHCCPDDSQMAKWFNQFYGFKTYYGSDGEKEEIGKVMADESSYINDERALLINKKNEVRIRQRDAWAYNVGLLKLVIDFIRLLFYVIEVRIMVYIFLTLIPKIFLRLRDGMVENYMRRRST